MTKTPTNREDWPEPEIPSDFRFWTARGWREPFVSTPEAVVHRMMRIAAVVPGERVYDLGCGDGRIPIIAALHYQAHGFGVEIRKTLAEAARARAAEFGVSERVTIVHGSFNRVDLRDADVICLYFTSRALAQLETKLETRLRAGSRIVTHDHPILGWTPSKVETLRDHAGHPKGEIFLYAG